MKVIKDLVGFAQSAKGLDDGERVKLILFAAGLKKATFIALKVSPKNVDEKEHFERHLKENNVVFEVGRAKAYEEIDRITGSKVVWKVKGTWFGYDLFRSNNEADFFDEYVQLLKKQKHAKADLLGGKLYDYPVCCVKEYTREHDVNYLKKRYSYLEYYKRIHETDSKFPFILHYPCSTKCRATAGMNSRHASIVRKLAPKFWKRFAGRKTFRTELIVDLPSDVVQDDSLEGGATIWPKKDGFDYALISKKPFDGHYYIFSHLTKEFYERGTVLDGTVALQFNYPMIKIKSVKGIVEDLHHERKFAALGRRY